MKKTKFKSTMTCLTMHLIKYYIMIGGFWYKQRHWLHFLFAKLCALLILIIKYDNKHPNLGVSMHMSHWKRVDGIEANSWRFSIYNPVYNGRKQSILVFPICFLIPWAFMIFFLLDSKKDTKCLKKTQIFDSFHNFFELLKFNIHFIEKWYIHVVLN